MESKPLLEEHPDFVKFKQLLRDYTEALKDQMFAYMGNHYAEARNASDKKVTSEFQLIELVMSLIHRAERRDDENAV